MNSGRGRYAPITLLPMLFVTTTTLTAGVMMLRQFLAMMDSEQKWTGVLNFSLTLFVIVCVATLLLMAVARWIAVWRGVVPVLEDGKTV